MLNQSRTIVLFVMPTTAGPTARAARTAGVLRASDKGFWLAACSTAMPPATELSFSFAVLSEQPAKSTAPTTKTPMAPERTFFFLFQKQVMQNPPPISGRERNLAPTSPILGKNGKLPRLP